jgi:hypothetical protein
VSRCAAGDDDAVTIQITAYGTHARAKLRREILNPDALHDVSLTQIVLHALVTQAARPKLAALAKRSGTLTPQLPPVFNKRLLALRAYPAACRHLPRTRLQQPRTREPNAALHAGSDALVGNDALTQLTRAQLRRRPGCQRQARIEPRQRPIFVGCRVVATQMPRRERTKPAATEMALHSVLVSVIRQHPERRVQPLAADVVGVLHASDTMAAGVPDEHASAAVGAADTQAAEAVRIARQGQLPARAPGSPVPPAIEPRPTRPSERPGIERPGKNEVER